MCVYVLEFEQLDPVAKDTLSLGEYQLLEIQWMSFSSSHDELMASAAFCFKKVAFQDVKNLVQCSF